jgi:hypothetical protein
LYVYDAEREVYEKLDALGYATIVSGGARL